MFSKKRLSVGVRPTYCGRNTFRSITTDGIVSVVYDNDVRSFDDANEFSPSVIVKNPSLIVHSNFSIDNSDDFDFATAIDNYSKQLINDNKTE